MWLMINRQLMFFS